MDKIIVAATQNKHKIVEIEAITKEFGMSVISRKDAGVPDVEIVEDGSTFEEPYSGYGPGTDPAYKRKP